VGKDLLRCDGDREVPLFWEIERDFEIIRILAAELAPIADAGAADIEDERGRKLEASLRGKATYKHADISREEDMRELVNPRLKITGDLT
jgi:hypothetical protein